MYKYNLGKYRLMYGTTVYKIVFGFIPIKICNIEGTTNSDNKMYTDDEGNPGTLEIFHQIVNGKLHVKKLFKDNTEG
jgi:hypothetical protein